MFVFGILVALFEMASVWMVITDKSLSAGGKLMGTILFGGAAVYAISSALLLR